MIGRTYIVLVEIFITRRLITHTSKSPFLQPQTESPLLLSRGMLLSEGDGNYSGYRTQILEAGSR